MYTHIATTRAGIIPMREPASGADPVTSTKCLNLILGGGTALLMIAKLASQ